MSITRGVQKGHELMTTDLFNLTGRIALVTGSSQGLGLTIARGLGEAGSALVLNGRNEEKLAAAAKRLGRGQVDTAGWVGIIRIACRGSCYDKW